MVRAEAYKAVGGYSVSERLLRQEDYHLWLKMYEKGFRGFMLSEPLYSMRDDRNAANRRKFRYRLNEVYMVTLVVKTLNLPKWKYIYALRSFIIGLLPGPVYRFLHKRRIQAG